MGKVKVKGDTPAYDMMPEGDSDADGQGSEDVLSSLSHITVILENGQHVEFSVAKELLIPDDPDGLLDAARRAHERYAFWAYQTERALRKLRAEELKCKDTEGEYNMRYRLSLLDDARYSVTEGSVNASVDMDPKVKEARAQANSARYTYGVFRTMRDAMHHRCFVVTRLIGRYVDMDEE